MKTTFKTKDLREAFEKLKGINYKQVLPVLSNAHIECIDGRAIVTATDLERIIRVELPREKAENHTFLLPRRETEQFLYGENGEVGIDFNEATGKVLMMREGIGEANLIVPSAKDFPPLKMPQGKLKWHTIDGGWFCRALQIVSSACATEPTRPVLEGVLFKDGMLVAADGFRLVAYRDRKFTFGLNTTQAIIDRRTILMLIKLFRKEGVVDVAFESDGEGNILYAYFKSGNVTFISTVTQGTYPKYEQLIPSKFLSRVSFSTPLFEQRLKMLTPEAIHSSIVRFKFGKIEPNGEHECSMKAGGVDLEWAGDLNYSLKCPVKIETEEGARIAFNLKFILDVLRPFSMCNLELTSPSSPGKFTGDVEGLTIMVMPMLAQWD